MYILVLLKFTPLEFEANNLAQSPLHVLLKFTPLEFEARFEV